MDALGNELPLKKSLFKWTSSNSKVAKLKANADGTATLTIPKKAAGMSRITLTANDKAKTEQIFILHVRDYAPKLAETKFTLDWWKQPENSYVPLNLSESYGNTITDVAVTEYNRVTKLYDVPSPNFDIRQEEDGSFSIGMRMNPAQSKGAVKASLNVTCANGKTYSFLISATIQNKQPKFTLVQFNPLNYFYNDCSAQLGSTFTLGGDTPLLEKLEISENNQNKDITVVNGNTLVLTEECINDWGRALGYKVDPNIVLRVKLFGYKPFDMNFKVKTERKGPTLVTDPAVLMITHAHQNTTLKFKVLDQATGENLSGYFEYDAGLFGVTVEKSDNGTPSDPSDDYLTGKVAIEDAGFGSYWTLVGFRKDNWMRRHDIECNVKYVKELPKVSLSEKALNLNSTFTQRTSVAQVSISDSSLDLSDLKLNFSCTDKGGTKAWTTAQQLEVVCKDGVITAKFKDPDAVVEPAKCKFEAIPEINGIKLAKVSVTVDVKADTSKVRIDYSTVKLNTYMARCEIFSTDAFMGNDLELLGFKENGNEDVEIWYADGQLHTKLKTSDPDSKYVFELTPKVKDELTGQVVYTPTKLKFTVQTYRNDKITIKMDTSGTLDTLNPDSAMYVYVSKLTNAAGGHEKVRALVGRDGHLFDYSVDEYGQITLKLKPGQTYDTSKTYLLRFTYEVFNQTVVSNDVKVKVTQGKYKAVISPPTAMVALSSRNTATLRFSVSLTGAEGAKLDADSIKLNTSKTTAALGKAVSAVSVVSVSADGRLATVTVTVKHKDYLDSGKKYTLAFDVTPVGNASNVKPQTITATVQAK